MSAYADAPISRAHRELLEARAKFLESNADAGSGKTWDDVRALSPAADRIVGGQRSCSDIADAADAAYHAATEALFAGNDADYEFWHAVAAWLNGQYNQCLWMHAIIRSPFPD